MKFYYDLYVSDSLIKKKKKVVRKLVENQFQPSIYVLRLSTSPQNHLEFFSAAMFKQPHMDPNAEMIVGIAAGYDDAVFLVEKITEDVVKLTGDADIRTFLETKQKVYEEGRD